MKALTRLVAMASLISWSNVALAQTPEQKRDAGAVTRASGRDNAPQLGGTAISISWQLNIPSIQAELKFDEMQRAASRRIRDDVSAKMRSFYKPLEGLKKADPAEWEKKSREFEQAIAIETTKATAQLLKPEQFQRFKQLGLQRRGASALADEDLQSALGLTGEQRKMIEKIIDDENKNFRESKSEYDKLSREQLILYIKKRAKSFDEKVAKELTAEQQKKWNQILGPPLQPTAETR